MKRLSANTISQRLGCTQGCVLWAAKQAGVRRFWCCEEAFTYDELLRHRDDDCRGFAAWIEFEAGSDIMPELARQLEVEPEELCKP